MDIQFYDSNEVPQPRDKVRIEKLTAAPYPDGYRVRIGIEVTPFQERPSLEVQLRTIEGRDVAQLSIIETMHHSMEFTMHIRGIQDPTGSYLLAAELYYDDRLQVLHRDEIPFSIGE